MIVSMWMTRDPHVVRATTSTQQAALAMRMHRIRRLPVVDENDLVVGMITASDLLRASPSGQNPLSERLDEKSLDLSGQVGEYMCAPPVTVAPDAPLEAAAALLSERKIGALAVVLRDRLSGIITESDIFRAFASVVGGDGRGVRVTFRTEDTAEILEWTVGAAKRHRLAVRSFITGRQDQQGFAVARLVGPEITGFVDELWKSGHSVLSVINDSHPIACAVPLPRGKTGKHP